MNDGRIIRVPVPEPSEERRKEMGKIAGRSAEEQRIAIRNIRREGNDALKAAQKANDITEDDRDSALKQVQDLTNKYIKQIDEGLAAKEKDIMDG